MYVCISLPFRLLYILIFIEEIIILIKYWAYWIKLHSIIIYSIFFGSLKVDINNLTNFIKNNPINFIKIILNNNKIKINNLKHHYTKAVYQRKRSSFNDSLNYYRKPISKINILNKYKSIKITKIKLFSLVKIILNNIVKKDPHKLQTIFRLPMIENYIKNSSSKKKNNIYKCYLQDYILVFKKKENIIIFKHYYILNKEIRCMEIQEKNNIKIIKDMKRFANNKFLDTKIIKAIDHGLIIEKHLYSYALKKHPLSFEKSIGFIKKAKFNFFGENQSIPVIYYGYCYKNTNIPACIIFLF